MSIFKDLARECLRRRIITPYDKLPHNEPFNVLTYGCRLRLSSVRGERQRIAIVDFLRVNFYFIYVLGF